MIDGDRALTNLQQAYAAAWEEWFSSGDEQVWEIALADGLDEQPAALPDPPAA